MFRLVGGERKGRVGGPRGYGWDGIMDEYVDTWDRDMEDEEASGSLAISLTLTMVPGAATTLGLLLCLLRLPARTDGEM